MISGASLNDILSMLSMLQTFFFQLLEKKKEALYM
jgi:hypothetical protein